MAHLYELIELDFAEKAKSLAVFAGICGQVQLLCQPSSIRLGERTKWKHDPRQLLLCEVR
jgi:hypothetical protein